MLLSEFGQDLLGELGKACGFDLGDEVLCFLESANHGGKFISGGFIGSFLQLTLLGERYDFVQVALFFLLFLEHLPLLV